MANPLSLGGRPAAAILVAMIGAGMTAQFPAETEAGEIVLRVPDYVLSGAFLQALRNSTLKLDNYGSKHGNSWLDQQSRLRLPDGRVVAFAIPEITVAVAGVRQWRYYVDELNSKAVHVGLDKKNPSRLSVTISFEDSGHEVKGRCLRKKITGGWRECTLNIERDMQATAAAHLKIRPKLMNGKVGYELLKTRFESHVYPANALCKLAVNVCNVVSGFYQTPFRDLMRKQLEKGFGNPKTIRAIAANATAYLNASLGVELKKKLGSKPKSWTIKALAHDDEGWRVRVAYVDPPPRKTAPKKAKVVATIQKLETTVTPAAYRGSCPATLRIGGYVTTGHPATVTFRIVDDNGWTSSSVTWKFKKAGRHQLYTWQRKVAPPMNALAAKAGSKLRVVRGWYRVELLAPVAMKGPKASYTVTCMKAVKAVLPPGKPQ